MLQNHIIKITARSFKEQRFKLHNEIPGRHEEWHVWINWFLCKWFSNLWKIKSNMIYSIITAQTKRPKWIIKTDNWISIKQSIWLTKSKDESVLCEIIICNLQAILTTSCFESLKVLNLELLPWLLHNDLGWWYEYMGHDNRHVH